MFKWRVNYCIALYNNHFAAFFETYTICGFVHGSKASKITNGKIPIISLKNEANIDTTSQIGYFVKKLANLRYFFIKI